MMSCNNILTIEFLSWVVKDIVTILSTLMNILTLAINLSTMTDIPAAVKEQQSKGCYDGWLMVVM